MNAPVACSVLDGVGASLSKKLKADRRMQQGGQVKNGRAKIHRVTLMDDSYRGAGNQSSISTTLSTVTNP